MTWAKITNHRNQLKDIPVKKVQDSAGTSFGLTSISDGNLVVRSGANLTGLAINSATIATRSYGNMYFVGKTDETGLTANIWTKMSGATTTGLVNEFTMSASNRLLYRGSPTTKFGAAYNISFQTTDDARNIDFALAVGGVVQSSSMSRQYITGSVLAGKMGAVVSGKTILNLAATNYVELWAKSDGTTQITGSHVQVVLERI